MAHRPFQTRRGLQSQRSPGIVFKRISQGFAFGRALGHDQTQRAGGSTLLVLVLVIATKMILARWMGDIGAEAESTSVQADAWHHWADALTSIAAFVGITIGLVGGPGYEPADDWAALIACGVIVLSGVNLLRMAVRELLDAAPAKDFEEKVRELASGVEGVRALDKCRIRKSGTRYFVELHVEVDGRATVQEGHDIGGRVRSVLRGSPLRIADAFIHIEPTRR
jgi:cation diffusion facilitator family transporter